MWTSGVRSMASLKFQNIESIFIRLYLTITYLTLEVDSKILEFQLRRVGWELSSVKRALEKFAMDRVESKRVVVFKPISGLYTLWWLLIAKWWYECFCVLALGPSGGQWMKVVGSGKGIIYSNLFRSHRDKQVV